MPGRNVTLVCGVSGTGKTTFALRYLVNAPLTCRFVFDPDTCEQRPGQPTDPRGEFAARLGMREAFDLHTLSLGLVRGWVCFSPHLLFPGNLQAACEFFCEWAFEKSAALPGQKLLVIDEAWAYQSPHGIPPEIAKCVQSGRRRGLHVMLLTQQPNRFNDAIKNGASEVVCFKLTSPAALDLVEGSYGFDRLEVGGLQTLQFIGRNVDTGGELRGRIKI